MIVKTVKWRHPTETSGFVELLDRLGGSSSIDVVMEPSGLYGDGLRWQLGARGYAVYRVSPKAVHDYREVLDGVPSCHDAKSCALISNLHAQGRSRPWPFPSDREREFKSRVYLLTAHEGEYRRNFNRLCGLVCRYWPELTDAIGLDTLTALDLLRRYGGPGAVAANASEAKVQMHAVGGYFLDRSTTDAVVESARSTVGVPQIDAEAEAVQRMAEEVIRCRSLKAETEKELRELTKSTPSAAAMATAVGKTTAAVMLAPLGETSCLSSGPRKRVP